MPTYLFALTHSARPMDFPRAELNYLTKRYASPDRLKNLPPLATLPPESGPNYTGNISLWCWDSECDLRPRLVEFIRKDYKAQHAVVVGDELVVCGTTRLEVFPLVGSKERPLRTISHPWFAGGHTVFVDGEGNYVVSCSAPDAVLVFNRTGDLLRVLRVPADLYGTNYELQPANDLREHYISNDLQLAHLNCSYPTNRGVLCTLLIPGAIGLFAPDGSYREIKRGYVGCHAAKWNPRTDTLYFADSCNGNIVELNWDGRIIRRHHLNSVWLQDVTAFDSFSYLVGASDRNTFELWHKTENRAIWTIDGRRFGAATQFCSWCELPSTHQLALNHPTGSPGIQLIPSELRLHTEHAQERFCTDALRQMVEKSKAAIPAIARWARDDPQAALFTESQWFQVMAACWKFAPDLILEIGTQAGRSTAALASANSLLNQPATVIAYNAGDAWARVAALDNGSLALRADLAIQFRDGPLHARALEPALAAASRVFIMASNLGPDDARTLLSELLPLLANKEHFVLFPAISDARHIGQLGYEDGGEKYLMLGNAVAHLAYFPKLMDFVFRNRLTLFSADAALDSLWLTDPAVFNQLKASLGGAFSNQAHWRWLTLNEKPGPFVFPAVDVVIAENLNMALAAV